MLFMQCAFAQIQNKKLVWQENFDGTDLNQKNWNFETGNGCPSLCGWGNNESQIYTNSNHVLKNGKLIITVQKKDNIYTSTKITTKSKKEFLNGYIEARAKLPIGQGLWPAFWMLGANITEIGWPKCGEIDILEYVGREPHTVYTTLHTQDSHGNSVNTKKTFLAAIENGFHTYGIDWTKNKIDFFVDKKLVYHFEPTPKNGDTWPFDKPFYVILNLAIGGNFGGFKIDDSVLPQQFTIDYVKVYQ